MKSGDKVKHWTILYVAEKCSPYRNKMCIGRCDCGRLFHLRCGRIPDVCVCCRNRSKTKLYDVWKSMRERCRNTHNRNYGGRGIKVCAAWENYDSFKEWSLTNGYSEGLTIDRIDCDGDYCPENCRWTTYHVQNANRRKLPKNKSGATGVFCQYNKHYVSYEARCGGKRLGFFKTLAEAVEARNNYIIENNLTEYRIQHV